MKGHKDELSFKERVRVGGGVNIHTFSYNFLSFLNEIEHRLNIFIRSGSLFITVNLMYEDRETNR